MLEKTKSSPVDARTYYKTGNEYYEKGDYEKAIENYNMAILLSPIFSEAYFNRALSYYQLKNFEKSIKDYTKAIELDPKNPIMYNNRGDAFYRKEDFHSAIKDYDKAISLNPEYLKAYYNRGLSYASLEDYEKAVADFTKVVELKADFAEAYHLRGLAYEYNGNLDKAVKDYEKALEIAPELEDAKTHLDAAKGKLEQSGSGGTGEGGSGDGKSDIKMLEKPKTSFRDVAGLESTKEDIRDSIVYPMMNPELARKYGKLGGGGVLMYGPPGCGKCISGDTPVLLANGEIKTIENIYESRKNLGEKILNENEVLIEEPGIEVLSLNKKTLKIEKKKIDYIYKQYYKGKMYEITTHSGRKIAVTPEHPFVSILNGARKTKASELKKGDYIAIPREIKTIKETKERAELEEFRTINKDNKEMLQYISFKHPQTRGIVPVYEVDEEMAYYFGSLLSEGAVTPGTMFFSNSDQKLIDSVAGTTKNLFGIEPRIKPDTSEGVQKVEIGSVSLIKFLEKAHDFKLRGSKNTRIPVSIMESNNKIVSRFLSAVFECEGTVRQDVPEIEFSTASREFVNGIAYLLLRFGIVGRIKSKRIKGRDHTYWRIYISGQGHLKSFEKAIGFGSEKKISKLRKWTSRDTAGITNVDVIPNIQELLRNIRKELGMNKSEFYGSKNGYRYELEKNMSKDYLKRITEGKDPEKINELRVLADSEVLWDNVVEIEVKEFDGYVYDLTVAENHTFIAGFGGLIVHNTYVVKASAGECASGFINAKLSDLLDMYVGNTEKNIHKVFELGRKNVPCIIFFDEVDAIGGRRDQQQGQQYMRMAVNQLLTEMDGIESNNENVLVVAATNAPWDVDPALRRSGRFSKSLFLPEPDFVSRREILKLHAKKRPIAKNIPFTRLAMATEGYASSDLKAVVDQAASFPWKEAFKEIEKRKAVYTAQGIAQEEARERATKETRQRDIHAGDFLNAIKKQKSSLPPWYEQAKKQIGKQEEITIIDGKEHKKVNDSKMGPGEKQMFKKLLDMIDARNKWYNKIKISIIRYTGLYLPIPV